MDPAASRYTPPWLDRQCPPQQRTSASRLWSGEPGKLNLRGATASFSILDLAIFENSQYNPWMVRFRTLELYPNGYPQKRDQMIGIPDAVPHFAKLFKDAMLKEERFRTPAITFEGQKSLFGYFERIDHTAGFGTWARYQSNDLDETLRRGIDAFTLLLSGASDAADNQVIKKLEELVVTPTVATSGFMTQDYKIQSGFVDQIRAEKRPVGLNIYLRPSVVDETAITTASTAMIAAFFTLMGAEYDGD